MTIDELVEALTELKQYGVNELPIYEVMFVENHVTLITDLVNIGVTQMPVFDELEEFNETFCLIGFPIVENTPALKLVPKELKIPEDTQ